MQPADAATDAPPADRSSRSPISVAILAALACMPIVIAVGFLTETASPGASVPGDISVLALRGMLDAAEPARAPRPLRAGY